MARRKDQLPPFEIMGSAPPRKPWHERARQGGDEPEADAGEPAGPVRSEGVPPGQWWQWLSHAGPPLVLRVPRGLAISVVLGVLGLLVVAYWVGVERGEAKARHALTAPQEPAPSRFDRVPAVTDDAPGGEAQRPPLDAAAAGDPREPGLNYLVLATWNRRDARRLASFLAAQGVATVLEPWNNDRFRVVAVNRGFPPDAIDERRAYRNRMLEIGKAWKRHNNGRGTALEDMHFDKFEG